MADDVNSDSDDEIEYSGMIQPPLIKQLQTILSEYPDDGQILKEIIQNAEDAGASEMKILYDARPAVQEPSSKKAPFRKYFKGPALVVYNNAEFSEDDWKGIKMLYSSIKEFDKTKVGRFGLGFKSVFHITDYPVILSGDHLLVLDPHQDSSKVCQTLKLKKLHRYKKMKAEDCLKAFSGVFGFDQNTLESGHFQGTIFRFPLRQEETDLSDNIYDESKVDDLFKSFKEEAPVSLLFLKCLESVTLLREENTSKIRDIGEKIFSVHIDETTIEAVQSARNDMRSKILGLRNDLPSKAILNSYYMKICVEDDGLVVSRKTWKVMNLFQGKNNMSSKLRKLSNDDSLSYSPYVGVAMDMDCPLDLKGHVFCFLPLPLTEKSISGLPIHVNGFFALSQSRRFVKWPTADQIRNHTHTDKSIQWNQALVIEVLSEVYSIFLQELVEESARHEDLNERTSTVSHCIPNANVVDEHWAILISPLVEKLKNTPVFFTTNEGGKWIPKNQAVFLRPNKIPFSEHEMESTIRRILELYQQNTVEVKDHVWDTMRLHGQQEVTPGFINRILRTSDAYTSCSNDDKFNLIRYLLSAGQYNSLEGLNLVPLQNGDFIKFNRNNTKSRDIYMVPLSKMKLLVGMGDRMLTNLPTDILDLVKAISEKGIYQIRILQEQSFIHLFKETIQKNIGFGQCPIRWKLSDSSVEWLRMVWECIVKEFSQNLEVFQDLPLIPEKVNENEYQMHALRENILVGDISENISTCLDMLSIKVLGGFPKYISAHPQLNHFIPAVSVMNVVNAIALLGQKSSWEDIVSQFNNQCTADQKTDFLKFISKERQRMGTFSVQVLKSLKIFATQQKFVSIRENGNLLTKDLPVVYPSEVVKTSDKKVIYFAKELGAHELQDSEIFSNVLTCVLKGNVYSKKETQDVMKYTIEKKIYNMNDTMFQLVKSIPFVSTETNDQKTAAELFDPEDEIICNLVSDRSKFPSPSIQHKGIKVLRKLGLKSREHVSSTDIYHAAKAVHESSIENKEVTADVIAKQSAIFRILSEREALLTEYIPGSNAYLKNLLMNMEIVLPYQAPALPLPNLLWFRYQHFFCKPSQVFNCEYWDLIGHVAPVISPHTSPNLIQHFRWNRKPDLEVVLQQHSLYVDNYQEKYKSEYILPIKRLYTYLAEISMSRNCINICLDRMWMGDGFIQPDQIYINRSPDDIDIKPYLVPLPTEFLTNDIDRLAEHLGCKKKQTTESLISILNVIKSYHEKNNSEKDRIRFDMDIIIRILNKLKTVSEVENMNVPIPIHSTNETKLEFKEASECNYCNAEWLKELAEEDGESMYFVHEDVSSDTAAKLGVPSLTENLLSETEGIQEWGQKEPLTRRIKNLLKDYKDGFVVPKELVQNADDAKATKVCFLYDERENMDCRTRLIDESMVSCQGPALWAFNDALFSQKDLENITKLSGATKADDLTKVGKFGLGFCSVYNLTDVPSFITGSNMVIFDPHAKYIGKAVKKNNPGLKIDLTATKNKILLRRMKNQFKPFNGIFGCNLDSEDPSFKGTLFRFPFRTKEQAVNSEISDKTYNEQEIQSMIQLFVENAGNLLLFTQHVKQIEFFHLPKDSPETDLILLHRVHRKEDSREDIQILPTFGLAMQHYQNNWQEIPQQVLQTLKVTILTELTNECHKVCNSMTGNSEAKWFISWASGTTVSLDMGRHVSHKGVLPLASTAIYLKEEAGVLKCSSLKETPNGFYKDSHIFCYLPLPVNSPLPLHVNGSFAISSNRRQLSSKTTDDKNDFENDWNEALLADAVVNAYINLIENLSEKNILCDRLQNVWPIPNKEIQNKLYSAFYRTFYESIIKRDSKVFCSEKQWLPLSQCIFLDPDLQSSEIGKIATLATANYRRSEHVFLIRLEKEIIDGYITLFGKLPNIIQSKIITVECFYVDIFLENIDDGFWSVDMIKSLVGFALDLNNEEICSQMTTKRCIPTSLSGTLNFSKELVAKTGKVASMFCEEDERFPADEFESHHRQSVLNSMGMMIDDISDDLLLERINSIEKIAKTCAKCGIEKCKYILIYIQESKPLKENIAQRIRNIPFLPASQKPEDWLFPWFLDERINDLHSTMCSRHSKDMYTCILATPAELFMDTCRNLVGCQELVIDVSSLKNSSFPKFVFRNLGVLSSEDIPPLTVVQQLSKLCQNVNPEFLPDTSKQLLGKVCTEIYQFLDNVCKNEPSKDVGHLKNIPCLLIDDTFVMPSQTALTIPVKCNPNLYGLDRILWNKHKFFLEKIGVKKTFEEEDVIPVLKKMSQTHKGVLDERSLVLACNLVELLANVCKRPFLSDDNKEICIPDEEGTFSPIRMLCLDDSKLLPKGKSLKFIHPKIREADARVLGVQSKISGSLMQNYVQKLLPFGQKEDLSVRIKRILQQYPLSEAVLKEMLQNADDAKASEVMFITDFNKYGTEKTFDSKWHPLQGPALLVYNNSFFSDADIYGIQHLGQGSKGDDPTKTGQYGVGFNAVYHITDVPSFLSKAPDGAEDTLCVLDPNCNYATGANENSPGARFVGLNDLRKPFPDVFECYHENILLQSSGTVFRLPLRTKVFAEKSKLSSKEVTEEDILKMLQNLESEVTKSLLFLRNVKKITIASIKHGKLHENICTELEISEEHQKEKSAFDEYVLEKAKQFKKSKDISNIEQKDVQYDVILKRTFQTDRRWSIIQTFGFNRDTVIPSSVQDAFDDNDLGLLPQGGVAMPLDNILEEKALAFCFLPLPCETGLTMHINGHFSLDNESRRGLWKEDKKAYRTEWNNLLLSDIIAPIYARAMQSFHSILGLDSITKENRVAILDKIDKFHSCFPNIDKASDLYWKEFVEAVYKHIARMQLKMFLSFRYIEKNKAEVLSYALNEGNENVLFREETVKSEDVKIVTISKDLGAKLVDTPFWVCKSIESAGITITKLNADSLLRYLKSTACQINTTIEDTQLELKTSPLKIPEHIISCIEFCMKSTNFCNEIDGLPLCLLETENVVKFSLRKPVILTPFSDLIPSSKEKLLHHKLHKILQHKNLGCIEKLNIERLVECLPFDIDYDLFRHNICQWNPEQSKIPNKIWLKRLWTFLRSEIGDVHDQTEVKRILLPIFPWNIIPTSRLVGIQFTSVINVKKELYPLEKANHVIDLSTFPSSLRQSLTKLKLPVLDSNLLPPAHPLGHIVSTQDRVHDVLECLFVHRQLIECNEQLNINDCDNILEYFAGGLQQLLDLPNRQYCLTMLRKLPLYTTVHGEKINLEENRDILALPEGLPPDGMHTWAEKTSKILLRQNNRLKCIFEHFSVTKQSVCEVYVVHILPCFQNIPEVNRMRHLEYIRDDLLRQSFVFDDEQQCLIKALKKLPFIPQNDGNYKLASQFFNPFNKLMAVMFEDRSRFPPKPFSSDEWRDFMILVGMRSEITPELFIEFALQQESQGRCGLSEKLEERSKCLVQHLLHSPKLHSKECLQRVSKIKFIVPYKIGNTYCTICPYPSDESNHLISFSNSVRSKFLVTVWTQCRLLPTWVEYEARNFNLSKLGVQDPTTNVILSHIQKVCNRLGVLSETNLNKLGLQEISKIMRTFYEYASDVKVLSPMDVSALKKLPFVFVSEFPGLFPCERFTLQLDEEYKMKPYLMAIPDEFLGFIQLFETLGATRKISSKTFADILYQIHSIGDNLNANELTTAKKAMQLFFELLPQNGSSEVSSSKDLFLLSRNGKLIESKSLIYMNFSLYDSIFSEKENLNILYDIFEIEAEILQKKIKTLPCEIRPKFISEVVTQHIDTKQAQIHTNRASRQINDFFKSDEFINGVLRLVYREQLEKKEKQSSDEKIRTFKENLRRMQMICAKGMQRVYTYEGKEIERKTCFRYFESAEENGGKICKIYADFLEENDSEKVIKQNYDNISRAIRECTSCNFNNTDALLSMLCHEVKQPEKIETVLDECEVPSLNKKHKVVTLRFPKPGDVVEIRWHGILDNAFISFEPGEYVAYFSRMNERGDVEYKYAIIKEKGACTIDASSLNFLQAYLAEIEPEVEKELKVYELYKFNRSKDPKDKSIFTEFQVQVLHKHTEDAETNTSFSDNRSLDEIFKEIRELLKHAFTLREDQRRNICRRIMFKWHPDKNSDDVPRATKVFQYIRKIIQLLEDGKNVDVDDTEEPTNRRHPWSDDFFSEFERFYRREQENERRYQRTRSTSSPGTDGYQRYQNTYYPDPQPFTANMWLQEAKYDMRFAFQSENRAESYFSWICFTSYQAAEKALIAWQYKDDAKKVNRSETLFILAQFCPEELRRLATDLQNLTLGPQRMRYPEGGHQPSKAYTRSQASKAMELANQIIEKVDENL